MIKNRINRIVLGGIKSGAGKTTVTCALLRAFMKAGVSPAPFKCGPDFIDPMFHTFITGKISRNLDSFLLDDEVLKYLFIKNSSESGLSLIEGVMGLYDGLGGTSRASTAHTSKILGAPVILIADGSGISASIAAMLSGYVNYDRGTDIRGVIINNISGEKHYRLLRRIITEQTGLECLGYIPRTAGAEIPGRHLGLVQAGEIEGLDKKVNMLADAAASSIDLKRILEISESAGEISTSYVPDAGTASQRGLRIAVAKDRAFSFYYGDNLDLMKERGMELIEFSPMSDSRLPEGISGLYLGGGYPEVFAGELSSNRSMLRDIREKAGSGLPVYAECGGLMYLTKSIKTMDGRVHDMAGFFNCRSEMTPGLRRFGYVEIESPSGKTRGHEFHHSMLTEMNDGDARFSYKVRKPGGEDSWSCGLTKKNVLAGYAHIHFYSNMEFFNNLTITSRSPQHVN